MSFIGNAIDNARKWSAPLSIFHGQGKFLTSAKYCTGFTASPWYNVNDHDCWYRVNWYLHNLIDNIFQSNVLHVKITSILQAVLNFFSSLVVLVLFNVSCRFRQQKAWIWTSKVLGAISAVRECRNPRNKMHKIHSLVVVINSACCIEDIQERVAVWPASLSFVTSKFATRQKRSSGNSPSWTLYAGLDTREFLIRLNSLRDTVLVFAYSFIRVSFRPNQQH